MPFDCHSWPNFRFVGFVQILQIYARTLLDIQYVGKGFSLVTIFAVLHCIALHCIALYFIALHRIVLHCIAL